MNYKPDFLIKPYEVHSCPALRPSDSDIYAVVYWFERMRDGKCTASNETIADIACLKERTVGAALERLEKQGFIIRVYEDKSRAKRVEIKTTVHMTRSSKITPIYKTKKSAKLTPDMVKPGEIVKVDADFGEPTPGEVARDFFSKESQYREKIISEIVEASGAPRDAILAEVRNFYRYWTEPTKNGKRQLWETKPTFEVKRRLYTWLSRAGKYNVASKPRSGAGVTI